MREEHFEKDHLHLRAIREEWTREALGNPEESASASRKNQPRRTERTVRPERQLLVEKDS